MKNSTENWQLPLKIMAAGKPCNSQMCHTTWPKLWKTVQYDYSENWRRSICWRTAIEALWWKTWSEQCKCQETLPRSGGKSSSKPTNFLTL